MARRSSFGSVIVDKVTGVISIRWYEGKVRRQKGPFKTKAKANEELARIRIALKDDTLDPHRRGKESFHFVAEEWLKLWSSRLSSHEDDQSRYKNHVQPFFRDCPIRAIDRKRLLEFRIELERGTYTLRRRDKKGEVRDVVFPHKPNTIKLVLSLVRRILNYAVEHDYLVVSPVTKLGRGKYMNEIPKTKLKNPIESPSDVWRVLQAIKDLDEERNRQLYPFFCLLVMSGVRRGEALGLMWDDVDYAKMRITVRQTYNKGTTKSKKERVVPLHPDLMPILKAHKLADPWNGDLVFPNSDGGLYSEDAKVQNFLHEALRRCNLPRVRLHDLRHVFGSNFMEQGGDISVLQEMLGHSTVQLTKDTYVHMSPKFMSDQIQRVSFKPAADAQIAPSSGQISIFAPRAKTAKKARIL